MRFISRLIFAPAALAVLTACGGGSTGTRANFRLIQFVESGKNDIERNQRWCSASAPRWRRARTSPSV